MKRVIKAPMARRSEILDSSRRLVYTKGYEQMTIQDILNDLQISKGAFYHYFGSKQELLEALIEHLQEERDQLLLPVVQDSQQSALEKLQLVFETLVSWKTAQRAFLLALWRVLYADDNALFRQKWRATVLKRVSPLLALIIRQGIEEGILTPSYPEQGGEVILSMMLALSETLGVALCSTAWDDPTRAWIEGLVAAYTEAIERVLGVVAGSLQLVDAETLREWFAFSVDNPEERS